MSFETRWTDRARRDLIRVLNRTSDRDADWGAAVYAAISEKVEFIAQTPFVSSVFDRIPRGEVREVLAGSHRIFFIVFESNQIVRIEAIQHVRQQDPDFSE
jgi:plasmid stabilization system protein ParE